jgi:hypothetical protein
MIYNKRDAKNITRLRRDRPKAGKTVQWSVSNGKRRELGRAARRSGGSATEM